MYGQRVNHVKIQLNFFIVVSICLLQVELCPIETYILKYYLLGPENVSVLRDCEEIIKASNVISEDPIALWMVSYEILRERSTKANTVKAKGKIGLHKVQNPQNSPTLPMSDLSHCVSHCGKPSEQCSR